MNQIRLPDKSLLRRYEIIGCYSGLYTGACIPFSFLNGRAATYLSGCSRRSMKAYGEHTKIVYFPFLFYAIAEYFILKPDFQRFSHCQGRLYGAYSAADDYIFLCVFRHVRRGKPDCRYHLYTLCLRSSLLSFLTGFIPPERGYEQYFLLALLLFFAVLAMELFFTAFPPHIPLFQDSVTGSFGFPQHKEGNKKPACRRFFYCRIILNVLSKGREDCNIQK